VISGLARALAAQPVAAIAFGEQEIERQGGITGRRHDRHGAIVVTAVDYPTRLPP